MIMSKTGRAVRQLSIISTIFVVTSLFVYKYATEPSPYYSIQTIQFTYAYNSNPRISIAPTKHLSNSSMENDCERVLYYQGFQRHKSAGLDHYFNLFDQQILDAVHFNYTHLIIENMHLGLQHNDGRNKDKINQSFWHYLDVDYLSKISNINIIDFRTNPLVKILFRKYRYNQTLTGLGDICDTKQVYAECGITIRLNSENHWRLPKCFSTHEGIYKVKQQWDRKPSQNILNCIKDLKLERNAMDNRCFIHGMVRRSDRLKEYKDQYRELVSAEGISGLYMYLAKEFCADDSFVIFYLGTDGGKDFLGGVDQNLKLLWYSRDVNNFTLMTKEDLFVQSDVECSVELRENNYFLYKLEKEMGRDSEIVDVQFHFNPKYMGRMMFEDRFEIYLKGSKAFNVTFDNVYVDLE